MRSPKYPGAGAVVPGSNVEFKHVANYNGRGRMETGELEIQFSWYAEEHLPTGIQTGNNQPNARLARFISRLRSIASVKRSWFEGIEYSRMLSIIQIRISAIDKAAR